MRPQQPTSKTAVMRHAKGKLTRLKLERLKNP